MPDIKEVYEMVTKESPPKPDALERQRKRQLRTTRNKRIGAFAVAAAIVAAAAVLVIRTAGESAPKQPAVPGPATETPTGPFFLDLRTGEMTPLPESLTPDTSLGTKIFAYYDASPDGTKIAYNTCRSFSCSGADVMTVANIDGTVVRTLDVPEDLNGYAPRWSPDGSKLVYQLRNGATNDVGNLVVQDTFNLFTADPLLWQTTQVTDLELSAGWWFLSASFGPGGRDVIFHLPRTSTSTTEWDVWSVPVTGGEPTLVLRNAQFPLYFPDGEEIAFVQPAPSSLGGSSIRIADAQGTRRTLVEANDSIWHPAMSPDGSRIAYRDGSYVYVVDVSTSESQQVATGDNAAWLDDDTLIVSP